MVVATPTGIRLFSVVSGKREWNGEPGHYSISTELHPNRLRPGIYNLHIGVASAVWQDGGDDIASFEIVPRVDGEHSDLKNSPRFGILRMPFSWGIPDRH